MFTAYLVTNLVTGKKYVGVTRNTFQERWREHLDCMRGGKNGKLYNSMRKHGAENFVIERVKGARTSDAIFALEKRLIVQHDSFNHGYNMTIGGDGPSGLRHTDASKAKMSKSHTGVPLRPETVAKIAAANRGRKFPPRPPEWSKKISDAMAGKKWSVVMHQKMDGKFKGRVFSEEWKAKISAAKKAQGVSEATRAAQKRGGWKCKPRTPEHTANNVASRMQNKALPAL